MEWVLHLFLYYGWNEENKPKVFKRAYAGKPGIVDAFCIAMVVYTV